MWNSLARQQKIALKAVIEEGGTDLRSAAVLARYGIAASTMHKMLKVLDSRGLVREEETIGSIRYRLEDPFFARWLRLVQANAERRTNLSRSRCKPAQRNTRSECRGSAGPSIPWKGGTI